MELAVEDGRIEVPEVSYTPIPGFGLGERHAIGLAQALACELLINDYRPYKAARELGLLTVSVPEFLLMLRAAGLISRQKALVLLEALEATTADALMDAVRRRLLAGP